MTLESGIKMFRIYVTKKIGEVVTISVEQYTGGPSKKEGGREGVHVT